jgi:hypothetical protein
MTAVAVNRQWAEFMNSLASPQAPDPLLPKAMQWHPKFHYYLTEEEDRLALLQAECIRLCQGDKQRAARLAQEVIYS